MLSLAENTTMELNVFASQMPADTCVTEVMKELEEYQSMSHKEDSNKDCYCECEKDQCSCCRSTIGDLNTIVADNNQEDFNFDTPELTSTSRSVIKNATTSGHLSPQISSRTSQSGKKDSRPIAKDPFKVIRKSLTPYNYSKEDQRQESSGSNKKQQTPLLQTNTAPESCTGCCSNKKLIVELAHGVREPQGKTCSCCPQLTETDNLLSKPLAIWPAYVQYRVNPFFVQEQKSSFESTNLTPDGYENLHAKLLRNFQYKQMVYERALQELVTQSKSSRPATEKILKLKEVEQLLTGMLESRGLLEDLEIDHAQAQLFGHTQKVEELDSQLGTPFDACDPFLGKRRSDEDQELSRYFSWST